MYGGRLYICIYFFNSIKHLHIHILLRLSYCRHHWLRQHNIHMIIDLNLLILYDTALRYCFEMFSTCNFLILRELHTEFLKFKIHFAKISYIEFLIKKLSVLNFI